MDRRMNAQVVIYNPPSRVWFEIDLTIETAELLGKIIKLQRLVSALVMTKLGYCNSLLCKLRDETFKKLERVQNTAARRIMKARKCDHITPFLKQLHWLPFCRGKFGSFVLSRRGLC